MSAFYPGAWGDNPADPMVAARFLFRPSNDGAVEQVAAFICALNAVVEATRDYLPPDGISKGECINRVLLATDNPEINAARKGTEA